MTKITTLTPRFAAIQIKMLHLQFRMKKIYEDQEQLIKKKPKDNRDIIRLYTSSTYSFIDMLVSFENVAELMSDMFSTPELREHFDKPTYKILNKTKKLAEKWRPVRNRLGGHIDIEVVEELCSKHNFNGVFLSDDLECDLGILNLLLLEAAINSARKSTDIIGRDLDMRKNLADETKILVDTINKDWNEVFGYFKPLMELMYQAGKEEKKANTNPENWRGLITGN